MKNLAISLVFMSPFVVSASFAATTMKGTVSHGMHVPLSEPLAWSGACSGAAEVYCQRERNAKRDQHAHHEHARR
jgi:hypothetical protein